MKPTLAAVALMPSASIVSAAEINGPTLVDGHKLRHKVTGQP
jgi:hypothetical protein